MRPQIDLGEYQTSCIVESATGWDVLPVGEGFVATIRPFLMEQVADAFAELRVVALFEGSKLVATGVFLDEEPASTTVDNHPAAATDVTP